MTYEKRVHLVYSSNLTGDLIFMEIEAAEKFPQINDAINNSIDTGISWSKFKDKYAVPVYLRTTSDRFETKVEIHCLKCRDYGHKDGTFIKELKGGFING